MQKKAHAKQIQNWSDQTHCKVKNYKPIDITNVTFHVVMIWLFSFQSITYMYIYRNQQHSRDGDKNRFAGFHLVQR